MYIKTSDSTHDSQPLHLHQHLLHAAGLVGRLRDQRRNGTQVPQGSVVQCQKCCQSVGMTGTSHKSLSKIGRKSIFWGVDMSRTSPFPRIKARLVGYTKSRFAILTPQNHQIETMSRVIGKFPIEIACGLRAKGVKLWCSVCSVRGCRGHLLFRGV